MLDYAQGASAGKALAGGPMGLLALALLDNAAAGHMPPATMAMAALVGLSLLGAAAAALASAVLGFAASAHHLQRVVLAFEAELWFWTLMPVALGGLVLLFCLGPSTIG